MAVGEGRHWNWFAMLQISFLLLNSHGVISAVFFSDPQLSFGSQPGVLEIVVTFDDTASSLYILFACTHTPSDNVLTDC